MKDHNIIQIEANRKIVEEPQNNEYNERDFGFRVMKQVLDLFRMKWMKQKK